MASPSGAHVVSMLAGVDGALGQFRLDPEAKRLMFDVPPAAAPQPGGVVTIHGFAPECWEAATLLVLHARTGEWRYADGDEQNILAGLAYVEVDAGAATVQRAWITQTAKPVAAFPSRPERSSLMGTCGRHLSVFGMFDRVPVELPPAIVDITRSPTGGIADGGRGLVRLEFEARCDGGSIAGVGSVDVEVLPLAGTVESLQASSDFPARMAMSLRMRYKTRVGTFITDVETFVAERIDGFPPFGVELVPVRERVRVVDEASGRHIGDEILGSLVPLCYLDNGKLPARIPMRVPMTV